MARAQKSSTRSDHRYPTSSPLGMLLPSVILEQSVLGTERRAGPKIPPTLKKPRHPGGATRCFVVCWLLGCCMLILRIPGRHAAIAIRPLDSCGPLLIGSTASKQLLPRPGQTDSFANNRVWNRPREHWASVDDGEVAGVDRLAWPIASLDP
jgi:hypothetical protein